MFNVRYKLREPKSHVIPKGPGFTWARKITCDIDGTVISFKAPKHRPRKSNHEPILPKRAYNLEDMIFRSNYSTGFKVSDNWDVFELFHNTWAFNGPWFTGCLAELEMFFKLVRPKHYGSDFSLFHPRAFEKIIGDYLTNEFSTYIDEDKANKYHYIAPVNWQPLTTLPVVAVRLQVVPDESVSRDTIRHFVFFPITDQILACIQFIPSQLRAASQEELDRRVSRTTMYELMDDIINSIELKLSSTATKSQQAAVADLDAPFLVTNYPPLQWDRSPSSQNTKKLRS